MKRSGVFGAQAIKSAVVSLRRCGEGAFQLGPTAVSWSRGPNRTVGIQMGRGGRAHLTCVDRLLAISSHMILVVSFADPLLSAWSAYLISL